MKHIPYLKSKIDQITFQDILWYFEKLEIQNVSAYPILKGEKIYRARPTKGEKFTCVKDLSYNPWPDKFERASTPCNPMFYGTISASANDYPIITCVAELNQNIRSGLYDYNEQEIAFAEFEVIDEFKAAAIIFCKEFLEYNKQYRSLYNQFKEKLSDTNKDFEILEEFSNLYSSSEANEFHDYRISSAFSLFLLYSRKEKPEAILYPSQRLRGQGTNIAIFPSVVDEKLVCKRVLVANLYLEDEFVTCDYISEAKNININGSFELKNIVDPNIHIGRDKCISLLKEKIKNKYEK